jgi:uncharacterized membrane-anchored protein YhcB (DUF1043 family)
MSVAAGWYPEPNTRNWRWWDGTQWTENRAPMDANEQPEIAVPVAESGAVPAVESVAVLTPSVEPAATAPVHALAHKPIGKMWKGEARDYAATLLAENERLNAVVDKHGLRAFDEIDGYRADAERAVATARQALESERLAAASALESVRGQLGSAQAELDQARTQIVDVNAAAELQAVGLFDYENPAEHSATLATDLEKLRAEIKMRVSTGRAVTMAPTFYFNQSEAQGRKFMKDMSKVLLRAYNAEAENAVKATRAGNLAVAQKRLTTASEQIAKGGSMIDLRIDPGYHGLRLQEIALANRHLQAVAREKELERDRRAELREQAKAEAELRRAREGLDKERAHYAAALVAMEANGDVEGAARIREKLDDVERAIVDVDYRAANVRAGYVYVISNIGAFGERMVKIGMTRRLEPMDRVNELGDASVPFRFDVHALFFADDAVGIETMLHQTFADQRVNKVNIRREFFYVTPDEVLAALKTHAVEIVEYELIPEAPEFRASAAATA